VIPAWILDIFAALMLVVAAASAARLVAARPWRQESRRAALADTDLAHLLMAIAMAGMLAASLQTLPNGAWGGVFAVMTAWFAYRVARDAQVSGFRALAGGHCAPHLIHAAAMLYMFLAVTAPAAHGSGMSGMGGAAGTMGTLGLPFLAFIFALLLIGYSIWDLDQLSGPGASGHYSLAVARLAPSGAVLAGVGVQTGAGPGAAVVTTQPRSQAAPVIAAGSAVTSQALAAGAAGARGPASGTGRVVLAPWVATSCRIAMGVTMAFMLLIMI
jgi:opacity protein-like surface antigen